MHVIEYGEQSATLVTHAERPDLEDQAQGEDFLCQWPTFMFHDPVTDEHYPVMYERCPEFQFYVIDEAGRLLANGNSIPVARDGSDEDLPDGWDEALVRGSVGAQRGTPATALCALQATVSRRAPESMKIPGTRTESETWTGLTFSTSGEYVVDGGLVPVAFDADADEGVYIEPNVWTRHRL